MESVQFGSPLTPQKEQEEQRRQASDQQEVVGKGEKLQQQIQQQDGPSYAAPATGNEDLFDKLTRNLTADQTTFAAQFLKRFFPVVIFLVASLFGIGVGKTALVSGCMTGIYGEISMFFGLIRVPLYSIPDACHEVDKVRDFMSVKPLIFLVAFVMVFFVWSYFDSQLKWRDHGDF